MAKNSARAALCLLLMLTISFSDSEPPYGSFHHCLSLLTPPSTDISQLLHTPNSPSYDSLLKSSAQNLRFTTPSTPKPHLILTPSDHSQVPPSLLCSKSHGLPIRVRSGGHDYEGLSYRSLDASTHFALLDIARLRSVTVDIEAGSAWVDAGATIGELYYRIASKSRLHGFPAGTCSTVGVGGHVSGGGIGTLTRKFGLASDNVLDAKLVNAEGKILDRESMGEDLFWAIRGGGGASFGIILSWKLRLVPVPAVLSRFTLRRSFEQGAIRLLNRWQYVAPELHEDVYLHASIVRGEKGVEAIFGSLFLGGCDELVQLMGERFPELGLERDDCKQLSWIESAVYFAGLGGGSPEALIDRGRQPKIFNKGKSDLATEPIPEIIWEGIWKRFSEEGAGYSYMNMSALGGRMNEISTSETPFPHRRGSLYIIQYLVKWGRGGAEASEKHLDWVRRLYREMGPYVSSNPRAAYLNFRDLDLGENDESGNNATSYYLKAMVWGRKYFRGNFERLAGVKGEVDPENYFRNEQSIPPAIEGDGIVPQVIESGESVEAVDQVNLPC